MNFFQIYTDCIHVEKIVEIEPGSALIIRERGVEETIAPKGPGKKKQSIYLHLNLIDGHISYQGTQKSSVKTTEDGLLEGTYSVNRQLTLSQWAFTAIVVKTFELWKDAYTYYMVHGDSPGFNRFRDLVVIREERLPPVTLSLDYYFHEYYTHKLRLRKDPARIIIPLFSFSSAAFMRLTNDPVLAIPESLGEQGTTFQDLLDSALFKIPKSYI